MRQGCAAPPQEQGTARQGLGKALLRSRQLDWRRATAHSSSGLGHRPLTAAARVRIPYGPSSSLPTRKPGRPAERPGPRTERPAAKARRPHTSLCESSNRVRRARAAPGDDLRLARLPWPNVAAGDALALDGGVARVIDVVHAPPGSVVGAFVKVARPAPDPWAPQPRPRPHSDTLLRGRILTRRRCEDDLLLDDQRFTNLEALIRRSFRVRE